MNSGEPVILRRSVIAAALGEAIGGAGIAVIHASLIHLRQSDRRSKWEFLAALRWLVDRGTTIAVPTFSFGFCSGTPYDVRTSRSETGLLGDWLLEAGGAVRTPNPIYSFAVLGDRATDIAACPSTTTFGDDSPFALFERENARLVMLGCSWDYCTQFHRYEEEAGVPYRYMKTFSGDADFGGGHNHVQATMYVRDLDIGARNEFGRAVGRLREDGALSSARLGDGIVESVGCEDLAAVCRDMLANDPFAFVGEPERIRYRVAQRDAAEREPPLRLAVLGAANLSFLAGELESAAAMIGDRRVEVYTPPFGQSAREVVLPDSALRNHRADAAFFVDRLEDVLGVDRLDQVPADGDALSRVDDYAAMIADYAATGVPLIVVNRFACLGGGLPGDQEWASGGPVAALVGEANVRLEKALGGSKSVRLFDLASAAAGDAAVADLRLWWLGRFPFSRPFTRRLAARYVAVLLASLARTARLLVVDLDNTLWGGVLGEDGAGGLAIGGDYPGNAFLGFQRLLKEVSRRGIALAVCSKNNEDHVAEALESLPQMALRASDFAAMRVNWTEKWRNVVEIAEETNLGLESIGFIDDNPAERDLMRQRLPAVKVLDLPDDPALFGDALVYWPFLALLDVTDEDRRRSDGYRARKAIEATRQVFDNPEEFYASLRSRLHVFPLGVANLARTAQLVVKTNQFNATSRRHTADDLMAMDSRTDTTVLALGLEDKHTPLEIIGVAILRCDHPRPREAEIDTFLLSCRVLGRGVETGFLAHLAGMARSHGMRSLVGTICPTERNTPVRNLYRDHGFACADDGTTWTLPLGDGALPPPGWLTVIDHTEAPEADHAVAR